MLSPLFALPLLFLVMWAFGSAMFGAPAPDAIDQPGSPTLALRHTLTLLFVTLIMLAEHPLMLGPPLAALAWANVRFRRRKRSLAARIAFPCVAFALYYFGVLVVTELVDWDDGLFN